MSRKVPTRSELDDLLDTVKWGVGDEAKIDEVALALADGRIAAADTYTALHVIGRSGLVRHESLVASFLDGRAGMMAARISLQAVCAWFDRAERYRADILRFISGVPWDESDEVRQMALSVAGEHLRSVRDPEFFSSVLALALDAAELDGVREDAFRSLARALGDDWDRLPPAASSAVDDAWRSSVADRARQRSETESAW